jgi:hypothetical protein
MIHYLRFLADTRFFTSTGFEAPLWPDQASCTLGFLKIEKRGWARLPFLWQKNAG